jgi:hypothetical protein
VTKDDVMDQKPVMCPKCHQPPLRSTLNHLMPPACQLECCGFNVNGDTPAEAEERWTLATPYMVNEHRKATLAQVVPVLPAEAIRFHQVVAVNLSPKGGIVSLSLEDGSRLDGIERAEVMRHPDTGEALVLVQMRNLNGVAIIGHDGVEIPFNKLSHREEVDDPIGDAKRIVNMGISGGSNAPILGADGKLLTKG